MLHYCYYTVAVFGQSVGGVLQKVPLNFSVVSISEQTTRMSSEIWKCNYTLVIVHSSHKIAE